ncbi:hypothetical protein [Streptomyces violascens]|uniref:hypothetical protein n=1 Tax=Streptomyces violascens TaxID=67381 RepID=UPI003688E6D6
MSTMLCGFDGSWCCSLDPVAVPQHGPVDGLTDCLTDGIDALGSMPSVWLSLGSGRS